MKKESIWKLNLVFTFNLTRLSGTGKWLMDMTFGSKETGGIDRGDICFLSRWTHSPESQSWVLLDFTRVWGSVPSCREWPWAWRYLYCEGFWLPWLGPLGAGSALTCSLSGTLHHSCFRIRSYFNFWKNLFLTHFILSS